MMMHSKNIALSTAVQVESKGSRRGERSPVCSAFFTEDACLDRCMSRWNHRHHPALTACPHGETVMHLSNQSLLVIIVVGIVAGWLAGRVMEGGGFGLVGDLIVGLIGAFIGDWLLPRLGIHLGAGIVALIINAFIGAVVLLLLLRLVGGGYGRRWGRRRI
jgi:uncharacterized membrane protein YeaQ/YmgE (transglycosylase-associated protein family)